MKLRLEVTTIVDLDRDQDRYPALTDQNHALEMEIQAAEKDPRYLLTLPGRRVEVQGYVVDDPLTAEPSFGEH